MSLPSLPGSSDPTAAQGEEAAILADPRFVEAVGLFNAADWYACHDGIEALWHETCGPCRSLLQAILQIAVAHLHLERGNSHGATVLLGEGLGRLAGCSDGSLGLDLAELGRRSRARLEALQLGLGCDQLPRPFLRPFGTALPPADPQIPCR